MLANTTAFGHNTQALEFNTKPVIGVTAGQNLTKSLSEVVQTDRRHKFGLFDAGGQNCITVIEIGATACDVASSFNIISVRPSATIGIKSSEKATQILFLRVVMLDLTVI